MKKKIMIVCIILYSILSVFSQTEYSIQVSARWMENTPVGVEVEYTGDYNGIETTPFTIGPYNEPFTVTLTILEDHIWQWAELRFSCWDPICGDSNLSITVTADQATPDVSLLAHYFNIEPTPPGPTSPPDPTIPPGSEGSIELRPADLTVNPSDAFPWEVYADSGARKLAGYGIEITWPMPQGGVIMYVDSSIGNSGVEAGADGFIAAVNANTPGVLTISGFDTLGVGPSSNLHLLTAHFIAGDTPVSGALVSLRVDSMIDETASAFDVVRGMDAVIRIQEISYGDVNEDGAIDIIDALLVAQYYVGLNPAAYTAPLLAGDSNADYVVDIIDALNIAQYYVGTCHCPNLPPKE
ncbi:MAG: dockerin type I repeat-containing protein [Spirochaetales bacterium]|nr:dockerin type I repeat-containing protein [Spirochaetales bacterium]